MADFAEAGSRLVHAFLESRKKRQALLYPGRGRRLSGRPPQAAGFPGFSGPFGRVEPLAAEGRTNFAEFPSPVGMHPRAVRST